MAKMYFGYSAMNGGKTTILLQAAHNYEEQGKKVLVIKSLIDKKGDDTIVSRLGIYRKVDLLLPLDERISSNVNLDDIDCILVDEVQFMSREQVKELWVISKMKDIPVLCYGLKTDFRGELFEGSKAVIEVADEIEELNLIPVCSCGKKARFNSRIINGEFVYDGDVVAIDGIDAKYKSLCGKCYIEKVLKVHNLEEYLTKDVKQKVIKN